ncbi:MAG: hypothetical protein H8D23_25310 [Candidatus Brocadiales bacterium]|nr:hypothetical protein [Candidatus Brocadiales bacterium]
MAEDIFPVGTLDGLRKAKEMLIKNEGLIKRAEMAELPIGERRVKNEKSLEQIRKIGVAFYPGQGL